MDTRDTTTGGGAGPANTPPFDRSIREPMGPGDEHSAIAPAPSVHDPALHRPGDSIPGAAAGSGPGRARKPDPLDRAADRLDEVGETMHRGAGRITDGMEEPIHRAAEKVEDVADTLRGMDLEDIRDLVEDRVRDHPIQSLVLALALGWLAGKILR
jgi:hypothetical protein